MKSSVIILLCALYSIECRKVYKPIDKNANIDFINMEMGGGVRPGGNAQPAVQPPPKAPAAPALTPAPAKPPAAQTPKPVAAPPTPAKPAQSPTQIKPVPVNPTPAVRPVTTPGPGSVKQLVNFYDSQGKASVIRPYSYSQAVKQG